MRNRIICATYWNYRIAATLNPRNMVCFRHIIVNILNIGNDE